MDVARYARVEDAKAVDVIHRAGRARVRRAPRDGGAWESRSFRTSLRSSSLFAKSVSSNPWNSKKNSSSPAATVTMAASTGLWLRKPVIPSSSDT